MPKTFYQVRPRYSPGSPAMVSREIAEQVAADEQRCYEHAIDGSYGEAEQARAKQEGLEGIAEALVEVRGTFTVRDLITERRFLRRMTYSTMPCRLCGTEVAAIVVGAKRLPEHHANPLRTSERCPGGQADRQTLLQV